MSYKIGDYVKVKSYCDIHETNKATEANGNPHIWTSGKAKLCGLSGTIVDKLYSEAHQCDVYKILFDGQEIPSHANFDDESLEPIVTVLNSERFTFDIRISDTMVDVVMYENYKNIRDHVAHAYGYIRENTPLGVAQAASYAFMRLFKSIDGGEF